MSFNGINKTVSRNAGWYVPKYEQCTGAYILKSKEPGHSALGGLFTPNWDFKPVKCMWYKFECDTCGNTCSSTSKRNAGFKQCSRQYDIGDPSGINILCRKENDGTYSLIWDIHANGGYHQSYLSANEIRSLKDADEDDVFGTVQKDGQKWIATSPLTERKFRFKSRTLAITRLRNHLRKERLK